MIEFFLRGISYLTGRYRSLAGLKSGRGSIAVVLHWLFIGRKKRYPLVPAYKVELYADGFGFKFRFKSKYEDDGIYSTPFANAETLNNVASALTDLEDLDPAIMSIGSGNYGRVRIVDSRDLFATTGFTPHANHLASIKFDSIVLVPHFVVGGADKYSANIVKGLSDLGLRVLTIATLPGSTFPKNVRGTVLEGYTSGDVSNWSDLSVSIDAPVDYLARFINAIQPSSIFVLNSQLGLEMLTKYSRSLSNFARLHTFFFSMDTKVFPGQYGVRFGRKIDNHVYVCSDNLAALRIYEQFDQTPNRKTIHLPAFVDLPDQREILKSIENRVSNRVSTNRWLWYSRVEKNKGTDILREIAIQNPQITIDIIGPLQGSSLRSLGLNVIGLNYLGEKTVDAIDFSLYDGYLFTSLFEGQPNTVLEIAGRGIPVIATRVGDLDGQFKDCEISFVDIQAEHSKTAKIFTESILRLDQSHPQEIREKLVRANANVVEINSFSTYLKTLKTMAGVK